MDSYDFIVCGSGIAGLFTALEAEKRGLSVLLLTKGSLEESNTRWAQGGIAAAWAENDSPDLHLQDTLNAGAGLVNEQAARVLVEDGPARVRDLMSLGVEFDGRPDLALEAAHSVPRVLHAGGDTTGLHIEQALAALARSRRVTIREHALVTGLDREKGILSGVSYLDLATGARVWADGQAVVLATGGAGQLYTHTTNPEVATGDGVALAINWGVEVMDMEFYQFHPTALRLPGAAAFLISEAVRGEGGLLISARSGDRFMPAYHERAELAPRDIVARAIVSRMQEDGLDHVLLDLRHINPDTVRRRFPHILEVCAGHGLDITRDPIPVSPAAHYMMGGVRTNADGQTSVPGVYACGEVACTGVHGANRLASNSLLETVVFARRVVDTQVAYTGLKPRQQEWPSEHRAGEAVSRFKLPERSSTAETLPSREAVQRLMWEYVGIMRDGDGLSKAVEQLGAWLAAAQALGTSTTRADVELQNLLTTGYMVAYAALNRTESRGAHYRTDYPDSDPNWQFHQAWARTWE